MAKPSQYSTGAYTSPSSQPPPPRSFRHSSRKINAATLEYELDPITGGPLPMDSTAQRVLIAVTKATVTSHQRFITPQDQAETASRIREAVQFLVDDGSIVLRADAVTIANPEQGKQTGVVNYKKLKEGIDQSVQT